MIVTDFDVIGVAVHEPETDPPLVVDRDRVLLPLAIPFQGMETVSGRYLQVLQTRGQVHVLQLARAALAATSGGNRLAVPAK